MSGPDDVLRWEEAAATDAARAFAPLCADSSCPLWRMNMETQSSQRAHEGHEALPESTERVAREVVDAAIAVHRALGPGLLESAHEACLAHELEARGHAVARRRSSMRP